MNCEMKATVRGITEDGELFETIVRFKVLPPKKDEDYYGNGCMMLVKLPHCTCYVDIRYCGNPDVEIQADAWIKNYFGSNAREVIKEF